MDSMGDATRPRFYCMGCREVVYCGEAPIGASIDRARRKIKKAHLETACPGKIEYRAGIMIRLPVVGQTGGEG